jgi:hypothetical protein
MDLLKRYFSLFTVVVALSLSSQGFAAPASELWQKWTRHDADSSQTIDHAIWQDLTDRFVSQGKDGLNRFAYAKFEQSDMRQLQSYLTMLSNTAISAYNRSEQLAFWINLYNSVTIKVMLDNYPVQSIRDIKSGVFTAGPWDKQLVTVETETLTLNDIEHRILRPIWQDARIHYVVNCASISCPNLQPKAFTGANTEAMLETAAIEFINHPRAVRVENNRLRVSSIYNWYKADFGETDSAVIDHLLRYAKPALASKLEGIDEIDYYIQYNWNINSLDPPQVSVRTAGARVES